jgi:hypothetical protein
VVSTPSTGEHSTPSARQDAHRSAPVRPLSATQYATRVLPPSSYGLSAVFAATSAILVLLVRGMNSGVLRSLRGYRAFPWFPDSLFSYPAQRIVREPPAGAAASVVAIWLILGLTGAGRRPSDGFDRFCFLFGLSWVLWCLLGHDFMVTIPWLS